jgi:hypothetical protein
MEFRRVLVRGALLLSGAVALAVAVIALNEQGGVSPDAWSAVAAALAVVAALVSAWTSQRLVEFQEDALAPNLEVFFDARSRYGLMQLRLVHRGQAAYNVHLTWDHPLA